jgi:hypothetical protein
MYPWPIDDFHYVMDQALDIAMDYASQLHGALPVVDHQRAWGSLANTALRSALIN